MFSKVSIWVCAWVFRAWSRSTRFDARSGRSSAPPSLFAVFTRFSNVTSSAAADTALAGGCYVSGSVMNCR